MSKKSKKAEPAVQNLETPILPESELGTQLSEKPGKSEVESQFEKLERRKSSGRYEVLTEGRVAVPNPQGLPDVRRVYIPVDELNTDFDRKTADTYARELARQKPGSRVLVVKVLARLCGKEMVVIKLVTS